MVDSVMIVAGGSGGGFALGVLAEALRMGSSVETGNVDIQVVFACRSTPMARWFREETEALIRESESGLPGSRRVVVDIHDTSSSSSPGQDTQVRRTQTGGGEDPSVSKDKELESGIELLPPDSDTDPTDAGRKDETEKGFHTGRPDLPARIAEVSRSTERKVAIYACGPASMLFDVRNAAADAQRHEGEVVLHTEMFSW